MVDYIEDRISWVECIRTLKRDHRRYAKRQLTWFRADPEIIWKEPQQVEALKLLVQNFMSNRRKST
jgi:tRNA dimethylallyltransferase